jgi:hypothetical protein
MLRLISFLLLLALPLEALSVPAFVEEYLKQNSEIERQIINNRGFSPREVLELTKDTYLVSDYRRLYILHRKPRITIKEIDIVNDFKGSDCAYAKKANYLPKFQNPTSITKDNSDNIYIANYKCEDVLIGKIDVDSNQLKITKRIRLMDGDGPEGIAVDSDNLYISNHDSSYVQALSLKDFSTSWTAKVSFPAGIAANSAGVWVTSLGGDGLILLDRTTGHLLGSAAKLGEKQLAYPIFLRSSPKTSEVYLLDAITRKLYLVSPDFRLVKEWDMSAFGVFKPFGFSFNEEAMLVADPFLARISLIESGSAKVKTIELNPPEIIGVDKQQMDEKKPFCSKTDLPPDFVAKIKQGFPSLSEYSFHFGNQSICVYSKEELADLITLPLFSKNPVENFWLHKIEGGGEAYVIGSGLNRYGLLLDFDNNFFTRIELCENCLIFDPEMPRAQLLIGEAVKITLEKKHAYESRCQVDKPYQDVMSLFLFNTHPAPNDKLDAPGFNALLGTLFRNSADQIHYSNTDDLKSKIVVPTKENFTDMYLTDPSMLKLMSNLDMEKFRTIFLGCMKRFDGI